MALSRWAQSLAGVSLVVGASAAFSVGGCVEAEARFFVQCATQVETCSDCGENVSEGSFNTAACSETETGTLAGVCGYEIGFVLTSGMLSSNDFEANNNRTETSIITVYAYDIRVDGADVAGVEGATVLHSIPPEGTICIPLTLVSGQSDVGTDGVVNAIAAVKFYGRTTGGLEVETPEQFFPIAIYNDALDCSCEDPGGGNAGSDGVPIRCFDCPDA